MQRSTPIIGLQDRSIRYKYKLLSRDAALGTRFGPRLIRRQGLRDLPTPPLRASFLVAP